MARKIRIVRKRNPGCWGMAYPGKRMIEIDPECAEDTLIDIACHEVLHVEIPDLDESAVDRAARSIADVLWRLGFRQDE